MTNPRPAGPFQNHRIKHLSASSLNLFKNSPARWLLSYLFRIKDSLSPAMLRGKSAESAIEWALQNDVTDVSAVAEHAAAEFTKNMPPARTMDAMDAMDATDAIDDDARKKWEAEKLVCQKCTTSGFEFIRGQKFGTLISSQDPVKFEIDGIEVPIIGYSDFTFENGLTVDLKCVGRAQNRPKMDHALQIAGYGIATNYSQALLYAYPRTKSNTDDFSARLFKISAETVEQQLGFAAHTAHAIRNVLAYSDDPYKIASLFAPDLDSFYFSDRQVRAAAETIFSREYKTKTER